MSQILLRGSEESHDAVLESLDILRGRYLAGPRRGTRPLRRLDRESGMGTRLIRPREHDRCVRLVKVVYPSTQCVRRCRLDPIEGQVHLRVCRLAFLPHYKISLRVGLIDRSAETGDGADRGAQQSCGSG
jgi:hypothetical protein